MQRGAGRVNRQVPEWLDEWRLPALALTPFYGQHVVSEDLPEAKPFSFCLKSGGQLDDEVIGLTQTQNSSITDVTSTSYVRIQQQSVFFI